MSEALDKLDVTGPKRQVAAFTRFSERVPPDPAAAMHGAISQMHASCCELGAFPSALWRSPEMQRALRAAIEAARMAEGLPW